MRGRCRSVVGVYVGRTVVVSRRIAVALLLASSLTGFAVSVLAVAVIMMTVIVPSTLYTSNLLISNPKPKDLGNL